MPMASARLGELAKRLAELRQHFLPHRFSPIGSYTNKEVDMARAYRLLVHAEIEAYLEDRATEIIRKSVKTWKGDRKPRLAVQSVLAFHLVQEARDKRFRAKQGDRLECAVDAATAAFQHVLNTNHGIREENVRNLLEPIGIASIDEAWLSTMDSFGAERGRAAHSTIKAYQPVDPETEWSTVKIILRGLRKIDKELDLIIQQI